LLCKNCRCAAAHVTYESECSPVPIVLPSPVGPGTRLPCAHFCVPLPTMLFRTTLSVTNAAACAAGAYRISRLSPGAVLPSRFRTESERAVRLSPSWRSPVIVHRSAKQASNSGQGQGATGRFHVRHVDSAQDLANALALQTRSLQVRNRSLRRAFPWFSDEANETLKG